MRLFFVTQSKSLDVFYQLYLRLKGRMPIEKAAFYVANYRHYQEFIRQKPDFEKEFVVLKEWDIYQEAEKHIPNIERISAFEKKVGDPALWTPIVTDRRLYQGWNTTFHQDYKPRFTHQEQLAILDVALEKFGRLFDDLKPDAVCTIYTATFGDCLAHMFARSLGLKSLDLRLARLKNYVMFVDGIEEPPPHICKIHSSFSSSVPEQLRDQAEEYITSVIEKNAMYEGVVPANEKKRKKSDENSSPFLIPGKIMKGIGKCIESRNAPYKYDFQNPDPVRTFLYRKIINPLTVRKVRKELASSFVRKEDLPGLDYILYPLHTEPELVLSQFARPFLNQIEVIRNISLSMPVTMKLLVKEHPMMLGRRPVSYYKKILDIPNVRLVDIDIASEAVLRNARLVIVIRGAIGLEAVIKKIPVVALGKNMFDLLPEKMFRKCRNLYDLPKAIREMLDNGYKYDHDELVKYLAAVIQGSAPVNLISDLIGKSGRFRDAAPGDSIPYERHPHFDVLADYLSKRITER